MSLGHAARDHGGRVIAALAARFRDLDLAEESFAEACARAAAAWALGEIKDPGAAWALLRASGADDYAVRFYSFLGTRPFVPEIREISWDTNTNSIIEKKWAGTGTAPSTTWAATPTTRTMLSDVQPTFLSGSSGPRGPVFRYYLPGGASPLTTPLSASNAAATTPAMTARPVASVATDAEPAARSPSP